MTSLSLRRPIHAARILSILLFICCAHVHADPGRWNQLGPDGGEASHLSMGASPQNTLFAARNAGFFVSDDNGSSWQLSGSGLPPHEPIRIVESSRHDSVLYLSTDSQLYRSSDAGVSWLPVRIPMIDPAEKIRDISLRKGNSQSVAVVTADSLLVSDDGGMGWTTINPDLPTAQYLSALYAEDGAIYLGKLPIGDQGLDGAALIKTVDRGATWTALRPEDSAGLFPPGPLVYPHEILSSPIDPQALYVLDGSRAVASRDGGVSWGLVHLTGNASGCGQIRGIATAPNLSSGLFISCWNDGLHYSENVGSFETEWTSWGDSNGLGSGNGTSASVSLVVPHPDFPTTPTILAAADSGIFRTTNGGAAWMPVNDGFGAARIREVTSHPFDPIPSGAAVFAGGESGAPMYASSDGGQSWTSSGTGIVSDYLRSIIIDPTTADSDNSTTEMLTVFAAGYSAAAFPPNGAGIYKSVDSGQSWTSIDNGIAVVNGVRSMGRIRSIVADPQSCGTPPCSSGSSPLQTLFVAGNGRAAGLGLPYHSARIYKSIDAGANWFASDNGMPLPGAYGPPQFGDYVTASVVPLVVDPNTPSTLYAGTFVGWPLGDMTTNLPSMQNGVFKSTDGGANWTHSSNGIPRCGGPGTSHCDVLALAIDPTNSQMLFAGTVDYSIDPPRAVVYRSIDGGANWSESAAGLAGTVVRSLAIEPDGSAIYAGLDGTTSNPGGVYRSIDGGVHWNSISIGLDARASFALSTTPRAAGESERILLGTDAGIWNYAMADDDDNDGAPLEMEDAVAGGDGNGDAIPDSTQPGVASLRRAGATSALFGPGTDISMWIVPEANACNQLNDATSMDSIAYPLDSGATDASHIATGLVRFSLPDCGFATVRIKFHGAQFGSDWVWRNYGPTVPGNDSSFAWYSFAGASLVDAQTWELTINATEQGNYRDDSMNILFLGGPGQDGIFAHGFE